MRRLVAAAAFAAALAPFPARGAAAALPAGEVLALSYVSPADGVPRAYDLRIPSTWDGRSPLPALLLLHGRGGTKRQFQHAEYLDAADERGAVLVFWEGRTVPGGPGFPSTHYVDGADGVPDETDVLACLDDALARAPIDPDRVSLAGFSQGGRGALTVGLLNPSRFAALVDAAGPTDAFQGQLWSLAFPDYLSAAGGAPSAGGEVLARWFELSPRYLLPNARNLSVTVLHGQADDVVPDTTAFFPYRNGHHVSVTPGFADARGSRPTLSELHADDPAGYAFTTSFPSGVGHEQDRLLPANVLFDAALGRVRAPRPARVVGVSFGPRERTFHWARLARTSVPDGTRVLLDARADVAANRFDLVFEGAVRARLDLPAAGLDATESLSFRLSGGPRLDLDLGGPFAPALSATLDGSVVAIERAAEGARLRGLVPRASGSLLVVSPAPAGPLAEGDFLVPAIVRAEGANGARYETVLSVGNVSEAPLLLEALLLDGSSAPFPLAIPARSSRAFGSGVLLASAPPGPAASPLRLRVVAGSAAGVAASARVFNVTPNGTYGLSFPVLDEAGLPRRSLRIDLAPLRRLQLDALLSGEEPGASVRVTLLSGRIQLYGVALSNGPTNDPWRVPALPLDAAATGWTVPAVASAEGRNGAFFRSDLFLLSPAGAPVDATLLPRDGSASVTVQVPLRAGEARVVPDLLASLFPADAPGAGALLLSSGAPFLPLAVTRSDPATGASSQDLPCIPRGAEATPEDPVAFAGVEESPAARTNLVLVAPGAALRVRLVLLAADGARGERTVEVGARRVVQLDSFASLYPGGAVEGATLLVLPESGVVVASVSRIDNASNDPAGLAPLPVAAR